MRRRRQPRLPRGARRLRRARVPRQPRDVHARPVRRPRRPRAAHGRRAAHRRAAAGRRRAAVDAERARSRTLTRRAGRSRCSYGPHGAPDFFTDGRHRGRSSRPPGRCTTTPSRTGVRLIGPEAALGARRRRRGRPAPVEHPRQRLRDRHHRLHRRHADHPRPRRPQPGRLRLPRDDHRGRALEDRPAQGRATGALRARLAREARRRLRARSARSTPARRSRRRAAAGAARESSPIARCDRRGARRPPGGRDPPGRRRQPARRVRAAGARSRAALPRARADAGARGARGCPGIIDLTPGIRSLQIHYDDRAPAARAAARGARRGRGGAARDRRHRGRRRASCTCRCRGTIRRRSSRSSKYTQSVRPDAPWCPSNIEFIRRINGLDSIDEVRRIVFDASYLVLGLGDVYLGAPGRDAARSAPPPGHHQVQPGAHLDAGERRRHRRRLPVRLRHGRARAATSSSAAPADVEPLSRDAPSSRRASPGCCASSTRSASIPVSEQELLDVPRRLPARPASRLRSRRRPSASPTTARFLDANAPSIEAFRARQRAAFVAERERWAALPPPPEVADAPARRREDGDCPPARSPIRAAVTGSVWQICRDGRRARRRRRSAGRRRDDEDGDAGARARGRRVIAVCCAPGALVRPGRRWWACASTLRPARRAIPHKRGAQFLTSCGWRARACRRGRGAPHPPRR